MALPQWPQRRPSSPRSHQLLSLTSDCFQPSSGGAEPLWLPSSGGGAQLSCSISAPQYLAMPCAASPGRYRGCSSGSSSIGGSSSIVEVEQSGEALLLDSTLNMEDQQQLLDHHHHQQQQEVQKHEQEQVQQQEEHKEQEQQEQAQEEQKEEQEQQSQLLSLPCTALLPALPAAVTSLLAVDRCGASALGTVVQAHRGLAAALSRLALLEQALQDKESLLQESRAMVRVCMC